MDRSPALVASHYPSFGLVKRTKSRGGGCSRLIALMRSDCLGAWVSFGSGEKGAPRVCPADLHFVALKLAHASRLVARIDESLAVATK